MNNCFSGVLAALMVVSIPAFAEHSDFVERGGVLFRDGKPFTGVRYERYPAGEVHTETRYESGLREGLAKEFALTGAVQVQWNFHAGKKHGIQQGWFIEGPKRFVYRYVHGVPDGDFIEWHMNGTVFRHQVFRHGVEQSRKVQYRTAEVHSNFVQRDGRKYGLDGGELCMDYGKDGQKK
jgi:antitoxin component YwqK of YwqJK toxin-antitoxin module